MRLDPVDGTKAAASIRSVKLWIYNLSLRNTSPTASGLFSWDCSLGEESLCVFPSFPTGRNLMSRDEMRRDAMPCGAKQAPSHLSLVS